MNLILGKNINIPRTKYLLEISWRRSPIIRQLMMQ